MHSGERQEPPRRPATVPVYLTAPFLFDDADELNAAFGRGELEGLYSRYGNPSVRAVEEKLAALEGGDEAVAFSSGMAAISATLSSLLRSGDRLLAAADLYGGTHAWLAWLTERQPEIGIERVPLTRLADAIARADRGRFRVAFLETPTNPLLTCCDLEETVAACRDRGVTLVVDNTFATPVLQNPLAVGAHLVVHSATKYLAGHSDVTAGVVVGDRDRLRQLRATRMLGGACLDPHAAFLLARGMRTLVLRVMRQSETATRLSRFLEHHPKVRRVFYPGSDPVARRQMRAGGGMLAFEVDGGAVAAALIDRLEVFQIIPSLGGVESGVLLPATTSHRQLSPEQRRALGISDGLVRVSCGIEDAEDLEADLAHALEAA